MKMGPRAYAKMRRMQGGAAAARTATGSKLMHGAPSTYAEMGGRVGALATKGAPSKAQAAKAMAGKGGDFWKSVKSGLIWGGGFGLGSRLLGPAEQPQVVLGGGGY